MDSHYKDKTVRPSYVYTGNPYTGKKDGIFILKQPTVFLEMPQSENIVKCVFNQRNGRNGLTHCGLVIPKGNINLNKHWLM